MHFYIFILFVIALSMDAFTASLSYGIENVRVPLISVLTIAALSGTMLTLSLFAGNLILNFVPVSLTKLISFFVLLILSLCKIRASFPGRKDHEDVLNTDKLSKKINKEDKSVISPGEALLLSFALSVDNITAGISTGITVLSPLPVLLITVLIHFIAIKSGVFLGFLFSSRTSRNLSWIGGVLLLFLAVLRIF